MHTKTLTALYGFIECDVYKFIVSATVYTQKIGAFVVTVLGIQLSLTDTHPTFLLHSLLRIMNIYPSIWKNAVD